MIEINPTIYDIIKEQLKFDTLEMKEGTPPPLWKEFFTRYVELQKENFK